jgi:hypothetical protein
MALLTEPELSDGARHAQAPWLPWAGALVALFPLLACAAEFRKLFWFGDEWDQLEEIHRLGVHRYLTATFAENFVPVFKALWLFLIVAGGGSYIVVLGALWITHAMNVLLLGLLLQRVGVRPAGIALALVWAGLPASNIETLGWTIQWSAVLALSFFLLAALEMVRLVESQGRSRSALWGLVGASLASSLSFSRGVLSGCAVAFTCALPVGIQELGRRHRAWAGAATLIPAVAVGAIIASSAQGNHQRLLQAGVPSMAARFAAHFFLLNPLQAMFELRPQAALLVVLGGIKLSIYGAALLRARGLARWLVWLSLVLDVGNSLLVGIGRFHTGLAAAVGSRYQYASLFCLAPAVAVVADQVAGKFHPRSFARAADIAAPLLLGWLIASPWGSRMRAWSGWRGSDTRQILQTRNDATPLPFTATVSTAEARLLRDRFHLH